MFDPTDDFTPEELATLHAARKDAGMECVCGHCDACMDAIRRVFQTQPAVEELESIPGMPKCGQAQVYELCRIFRQLGDDRHV